tara:strand:+ start:448 stop:984 length:537 start_codon:yes stop_codon:yes gene_type:complete
MINREGPFASFELPLGNRDRNSPLFGYAASGTFALERPLESSLDGSEVGFMRNPDLVIGAFQISPPVDLQFFVNRGYMLGVAMNKEALEYFSDRMIDLTKMTLNSEASPLAIEKLKNIANYYPESRVEVDIARNLGVSLESGFGIVHYMYFLNHFRGIKGEEGLIESTKAYGVSLFED